MYFLALLPMAGKFLLMERTRVLVLLPVDGKDWQGDLKPLFSALAELEIPARAKDSSPVEF